MRNKTRFTTAYLRICEFNKYDGVVSPIEDDDKFPMRLCVIDTDQSIAVDVKTKLKYDYFETTESKIYFLCNVKGKIHPEKRYGVFPVTAYNLDVEQTALVEQIINGLKNGEEYKDGNDIFPGEETYTKYLESEKTKTQNLKNNIRSNLNPSEYWPKEEKAKQKRISLFGKRGK